MTLNHRKIYFSETKNDFGTFFVTSTEKGVHRIALPNKARWGAEKWLKEFYDGWDVERGLGVNRDVLEQLNLYFTGSLREFDLDLDLDTTEFRKKVLNEVQKIPYGATRTYKDIAVAISKPKASRAVGGAVGSNPIPIIIPCHRVIGSRGNLVGFGGGLDLKKRLLAFEGIKF